jgi:hypothetical protein
MCFLLLLGLSKGTYGKKSKNSERKKTPHAPPNIHHAHPHALKPVPHFLSNCPSGFRGGFILPLLYKARTGPAGILPCPVRPCWPPSQPVSPSPVPSTHRTCRDSPVPSPPLLATVTASQPLSRFFRAGPGRLSVTDPSSVTDRT